MTFFYGESPRAQACMEQLCARVEQYNRCACGGVCSVLLLGSLSKGEGTVYHDGDDEILAGDVELLTVYPRGFTGVEALLRAIDAAAQEALLPIMPHGVQLDNCAVAASAVGRLEKKLLIYDAARYGVLLTGPDVRPLFPRVTVHNINREDVADIVSHRLYYVLEALAGNDERRLRYALAKNALDLATVWLFARGELQTTVQGRLDALRAQQKGTLLLRRMEACAAIKRGEEADVSTEELRAHVLAMAQSVAGTVRPTAQGVLCNGAAMLRRRLGRVRRALRYRHVAPSPRVHQGRLLERLQRGERLSDRDVADHLVLHGYPLPRTSGAGRG